MTIVSWRHKIRNESLRHFADLGYKTIAGDSYDGDKFDNPKDRRQALDNTPGAAGIMYTT